MVFSVVPMVICVVAKVSYDVAMVMIIASRELNVVAMGSCVVPVPAIVVAIMFNVVANVFDIREYFCSVSVVPIYMIIRRRILGIHVCCASLCVFMGLDNVHNFFPTYFTA